MDYIIDGFKEALDIIFSLEKEFLNIVATSIKVSFASTLLASIFGIPFGIWVGAGKFKGRRWITTILNTLMALPTVVIGLLFYSFLSRRGPLGGMGLLFTPAAMIAGQFVLAFPIIAAFVASGVRSLGDGSFVAARILGAGRFRTAILFLREAEWVVLTSVLAGFGRVFSEVGISMMLGGNIRFFTRNMTTAIALETSRGALSLGIALGLVLMIIAFFVNITVYSFKTRNA
ncbi:MAG: ABC transporter permease [Candidatus Omnitrophota bacterium]